MTKTQSANCKIFHHNLCDIISYFRLLSSM